MKKAPAFPQGLIQCFFKTGNEKGDETLNRPETRMNTSCLAEQAGFEPAVGFTPRTLSRRVT